MRNLIIPAGPQAHVAQLQAAIGPIGDHPHWAKVCWFLVDQRAPLFYTQDHFGEDQNLSNWFGLINDRAAMYPSNPQGQLVRALYVAHEFAHLFSGTPHDVDRETFAEAFHVSECLASYETELRIYDDLPDLTALVPFSPLLASWLIERGADLQDAVGLMAWRRDVIDNPDLLADLPQEAARLARYGDNHGWARGYWNRLDRIGMWDQPIPYTPTALDVDNYRTAVDAVDSDGRIDEARWATLVIDNVARAYRLCGQDAPTMHTIDDARQHAHGIDGLPLAVEETSRG